MDKLEKIEKKLDTVEGKFQGNTLAIEMLRELKSNSKRWFVSFVIVLILWFATIAVFIWYINQPVETTETITYTQEADTEGDDSPISQNLGE